MSEDSENPTNHRKKTSNVVADSNPSIIPIESVDDLANIGGSDSQIDLSPLGLDRLDPRDVDFLDQQTKRTLNRHAEIQRTQHGQAARVLRATLAITGLLITLLPFLRSFLVELSFAAGVSEWRSAFAFVAVVTASVLGKEIADDIYLIIESSGNVLSPGATHRGPFGGLLTILSVLPPTIPDDAPGDTVRTASILDELAPHVDNPGDGLKPLVICNRLNRIRRNESVIDRNTNHLRNVYQRATYSLERGITVVILLIITLLLVGT